MKTKFLVVLVMLFSFSCFAYERVYSPGAIVVKEELDERGYQVSNSYLVQSDGALKKLEDYKYTTLGNYPYLRNQEAKEVDTVRKDDFGNFNVKYKDGHEEQYHLNKDGRVCRGILPCR